MLGDLIFINLDYQHVDRKKGSLQSSNLSEIFTVYGEMYCIFSNI